VGGDYYDFAIEDGRLLLALGDVSGKGTGAALLMTVLRASVRGHWMEPKIADAVCRINRTVCQNVPTNKYITFFMAGLDPESGVLSYVNAGHNPPLLIRAAGEVEKLQDGGMVLGLFDSVPYADGVVELRRGDTLLVFSDGVTETWNPEGDEFGERGLMELAQRGRGLDAASLQDEILRELDKFAQGAKATDDRTLIVLKRY
jgi:serine phosphatase RsbU (regulator of sigma subunit)